MILLYLNLDLESKIINMKVTKSSEFLEKRIGKHYKKYNINPIYVEKFCKEYAKHCCKEMMEEIAKEEKISQDVIDSSNNYINQL